MHLIPIPSLSILQFCDLFPFPTYPFWRSGNYSVISKQGIVLRGRNTTGPPCSVTVELNKTGGGMTSSLGLRGWRRLQARRRVLQTTTDAGEQNNTAAYTMCRRASSPNNEDDTQVAVHSHSVYRASWSGQWLVYLLLIVLYQTFTITIQCGHFCQS